MHYPIIAILITGQHLVPLPIRMAIAYDITDHDVSLLGPGAQHQDLLLRPLSANIPIGSTLHTSIHWGQGCLQSLPPCTRTPLHTYTPPSLQHYGGPDILGVQLCVQ